MDVSTQDADCVPIADLTNLKLIVASVEGDLSKMSAAIKDGADVNVTDAVFGTPIVLAVYSEKPAALKLLLDKGANANATDVNGCSALIIATIFNREELMRLLVSRGADVNASCYPVVHGKRSGKLTALKAAKDNEATVKFLTDAGAKE